MFAKVLSFDSFQQLEANCVSLVLMTPIHVHPITNVAQTTIDANVPMSYLYKSTKSAVSVFANV